MLFSGLKPFDFLTAHSRVQILNMAFKAFHRLYFPHSPSLFSCCIFEPCSLPLFNKFPECAMLVLCFSLGQALVQGLGHYYVKRMVFGYQTRFTWVSAIISFLTTELGFSSVILGKCSPSFGFQQSGCQEGVDQTLRLIWFGTLGSLPPTLPH